MHTHTHTEQHFPRFAGTNPKQLNLQDPRFHFKAGMGHPKAIRQPQVIHFGGGGCPGNDPPLMTQQGYSSQRIVIPHSGN